MPPKTIRIFGLASFLNDLGADMIHSLWPVFLTQILGVNMALLGFIDGIGESLVSISQAISGYASDRLKRRKVFIWIGYLFGSVARFGYALAYHWPLVLVLKILDRSGKMRDAPRDAIAADLSDEKNRGRNFGFMDSMDHFGAVCGVLLSIFLISFLPIRSIYLLAGIPTLFAALLIYGFVPERKIVEKKLFPGLKWGDLNFQYKWFLALSSIFAVGSFSYSFLLLFAKQKGFNSTTLPLFYLIFMVAAMLSAYPFGRLADRVGRKTILLTGYCLWGSTLFLLAFGSINLLPFAFVAYGLSKGAIDTVQKTYVSELAPAAFRASALGTYKMVIGLSALPASLLAGILWEKIGFMTPFYTSLGFTAAAFLMLLFQKKT